MKLAPAHRPTGPRMTCAKAEVFEADRAVVCVQLTVKYEKVVANIYIMHYMCILYMHLILAPHSFKGGCSGRPFGAHKRSDVGAGRGGPWGANKRGNSDGYESSTYISMFAVVTLT